MPASCGMIAAAIERMAPVETAEPWDNVGLLVGDSGKCVDKVLLTVDVTPDVVAEAAEKRAGLIVSHHPVLFRAIKSIRTDSQPGGLLTALLTQDIAVYAAHTNFDAAVGGVNDALASALRLRNVSVLSPLQGKLVKIAAYVPTGHEEAVWQAMTSAGAGHIGNYSHCGFRIAGTGTFLPGDRAVPFLGAPGKMSRAEEVKLETVAPADLADAVVRAMIRAHPYEEPAYDVYPLQNSWIRGGTGRIGELPRPMSLADFAGWVSETLDLPGVRFAGNADSVVEKAAVCGGAGMSVATASLQAGAQVLVTGDIRYHEAREFCAGGLGVVDAGHFGTEYPSLRALQEYLNVCSAGEGWNCAVEISGRQADIWRWNSR